MADFVDQTTVCCMCGDVGFPDKLFRCHNCRHRVQHSYCSSYYREVVEHITMCNWCESEVKNAAKEGVSEFSGKNIKRQTTNKHPRSSGAPSPRRSSPRKYKLLKDVKC